MGELFFAHTAAVVRDPDGQPVGSRVRCDTDGYKGGSGAGRIFCYIQHI